MGKQAQQKQQAYEQLFRNLFQQEEIETVAKNRQAKLR